MFEVQVVSIEGLEVIHLYTDHLNDPLMEIQNQTGTSFMNYIIQEIYDLKNGVYVHAPHKNIYCASLMN